MLERRRREMVDLGERTTNERARPAKSTTSLPNIPELKGYCLGKVSMALGRCRAMETRRKSKEGVEMVNLGERTKRGMGSPSEDDCIPSQYPKGVSGVRRRRRLGDLRTNSRPRKGLVRLRPDAQQMPSSLAKVCFRPLNDSRSSETAQNQRLDLTSIVTLRRYTTSESKRIQAQHRYVARPFLAIMGVQEPKTTALIFAGPKVVFASPKPEGDSPLGLSSMHVPCRNSARTRCSPSSRSRTFGAPATTSSFPSVTEGSGDLDGVWIDSRRRQTKCAALVENPSNLYESIWVDVSLVYHVGRRARANLAIGLEGIAKVLQHRRSVNDDGAVYEVFNWIGAVDALAVCDSEDTKKVRHNVGEGREYMLSVECSSEQGEECVRAKAKSGKGGKGEANPNLRLEATCAAGSATMLHRQPSLPIQHEIQALDPAGKAAADSIRAAKAFD
ncbi:hypothetical protein NMY22_g8132 [Coprinellus aureogranulatus]|nr:hypothetical protein NMY22_g8132 [Coprinellus aureogranulatus]